MAPKWLSGVNVRSYRKNPFVLLSEDVSDRGCSRPACRAANVSARNIKSPCDSIDVVSGRD